MTKPPEALRLAEQCSLATKVKNVSLRSDMNQNQIRTEFEEWARRYGTWEVIREDDPIFETTGYTDLTLTVAWHAVEYFERTRELERYKKA